MSTLEWSILRVVFRVLFFSVIARCSIYILTHSLIVIATGHILQVHTRQEGRIVIQCKLCAMLNCVALLCLQ